MRMNEDKSYFQETFFKDNYENRHNASYQKRHIMYQQEISRLRKYCQVNGGNKGKIFDFGCGVGDFALSFGEDWIKYGYDISDHAISIARDKGIIFEIDKEDWGTFDLVAFRGCMQYMDDKPDKVKLAAGLLKPNGIMAILATPNPEAVCYRLFHSIPLANEEETPHFLEPVAYYRKIAEAENMRIVSVYKPYLGTPYAHPLRDMGKFLLTLFRRRKPDFAFWGNMIEIIAQKKS